MGAGARRRSPRRLHRAHNHRRQDMRHTDHRAPGDPSHGITEQSLTQSPLHDGSQAHNPHLADTGASHPDTVHHRRSAHPPSGQSGVQSPLKQLALRAAQSIPAGVRQRHVRNTHSVKARLPAGTEPFNALRPRDATVFHTSLAFWTILVCLALKRRPPTAAQEQNEAPKTDL